MVMISERVIQRAAEEEDETEDIGELQVAEYVVFLLALETYTSYIEDAEGDDAADDLIRKGISLVRRIDSTNLDSIRDFIKESLPSESQKKLLDRAFRYPPNSNGVARRTLGLKTALSRGGASTMRAVFQTNKALREVKIAVAASEMEDHDAALDKFAVLPLKNQIVRRWIKKAADTAGSGTYQNAVVVASDEGSNETGAIMAARTQAQGSGGSEEQTEQTSQKDQLLGAVEQKAADQAREAMEVSGEPDHPPSRSETVGIATAAAVAAMTDPDNPANIPDPIRKLDDEQRAAALTDGKVLVAAGAGAGKSTTVVSRVEYLVKDRRVNPSRVLVTSFNSKAASELRQKIGTAVGGDALNQMSVGTMHSLFRKFIGEYGTAQERSAMGLGQGRGGFVQGGGPVARAVQRLWADCYPANSPQERKVPKLKNCLMAKSKWSGNNITPAMAKEQAKSEDERDWADWYEMYEGLKGSIPGWKPPCQSKSYESFMGRWRPDGQRLGDFGDMLSVFLGILKRDPAVRKTLQGAFDHILVDECQDLNSVQNQIMELLSEHIGNGEDGKSIWMVGDDKQAIYGFTGARPDIFTARASAPGWKTKMIRTNYRCDPEIVEAANKLIAHNTDQIPMEANPAPGKARGMASVRVETSLDEADAALSVIEEIKSDIAADGEVTDNAILTRTNKEQHAFETACIIRGIPYARKGASSFLGSPETKAFLSYVQLVTGSDFEKMQKSLGEVINKPNRFFVAPDAGVKAVEEAIDVYARRAGVNRKEVNPVEALGDSMFVETLAEKLARTTRGFKYEKTVEKLYEIHRELVNMQASSEDPDYKTSDLFDSILGMTGTAAVTNPRTGRAEYIEQTFRDSLKADLRDSTNDDDDTEDDEDEDKGLGNIGFLFKLAEKDPTDPGDMLDDPQTPAGFKSKMERYAEKARELRIDITAWDKEQAALPPEQRKPPPGVYVGTIHSVKGAQWRNCYVSMPRGKFPFTPPQKPGAPPPPPEQVEEEMASERRLGYVALTRAAKNLTILCPASVGGKAAGVSPFVGEAGLKVGENVTKPGAETADAEVDETIKTATIADDVYTYEGVVPDGWDDNDWRPS